MAGMNHGNAVTTYRERKTQAKTGWQDATRSAMEDRAWAGLSSDKPTACRTKLQSDTTLSINKTKPI